MTHDEDEMVKDARDKSTPLAAESLRRDELTAVAALDAHGESEDETED